MKQRTKWIIVSSTLLLVFAGMWRSISRPLEEPRWKRHLEQYGGQFHPVPGKPHLTLCYAQLRFEYGPQTTLKPALFIRNERWTSHISQMEVHSSKGGLITDSFTLSPTGACSPVDWDSLRPVTHSRIRVGRHAYTLILFESLEPDSFVSTRDQTNDRTSINLEFVIDSDSITIDGIDSIEIDPAVIGLTRVVFDMASAHEARSPGA